ncbi:MAG: HDIG domain-containing protein [Armatimonadetes bacterium]|nr:HDIG domain-containing protein [Armatimonadota bacterium]
MTREDAYQLLTEYTKSPNLIKHALAVEAAMRFYARKFGGDEETWGITGLLHDFDYEQWPDLKDHPFKGAEILRERGYPEEIIRGVLAHADHSGVQRDSMMEKAIFAVDELTGFIIAVALVRPGKSLDDVDARAIKKKMKDKAFARAVSREDLIRGAEELGLPVDVHFDNVVAAMKSVDGLVG